MLLIAVSHGTYGDPFTCSTTASPDEVDPCNADACRAYICKDKDIPLNSVDEVLVVGVVLGDGVVGGINIPIYEAEVIHHHGDKLSIIEEDEDGDEPDGEAFRGNEAASFVQEQQDWLQRNLK